MNTKSVVGGNSKASVKKVNTNTRKNALQDITNKTDKVSTEDTKTREKLRTREVKKNAEQNKKENPVKVSRNCVNENSTKIKAKRRSRSAETTLDKKADKQATLRNISPCFKGSLKKSSKNENKQTVFSPIKPNIYAEIYYYIGNNKLREPKILGKNTDRTAYTCDIYNEEYLGDIYSYLKNQEKEFLLTKNEIRLFFLNFKNRDGIINWLVSIQPYLNFPDRVLFPAVQIFDFCLAHCYVALNMMQLLGLTSLWIASKFNEVYILKPKRILALCGIVYKEHQLYSLERKILKMLNYVIPSTNHWDFLGYYLFQFGIHSSPKLQMLAQYLMESFLLNKYFSAYPASLVAITCAFIAIKKITPDLYNSRMKDILTKFNRDERKEVESLLIKQIEKFLSSNYTWKKIFEKYKHKSRLCIANYFID